MKVFLVFARIFFTNERLDRIEVKIDAISAKVDQHDIKIQVLEDWRKTMSL